MQSDWHHAFGHVSRMCVHRKFMSGENKEAATLRRCQSFYRERAGEAEEADRTGGWVLTYSEGNAELF